MLIDMLTFLTAPEDGGADYDEDDNDFGGAEDQDHEPIAPIGKII